MSTERGREMTDPSDTEIQTVGDLIDRLRTYPADTSIRVLAENRTIVSLTNHPVARELRIVSLPGNRFGYRCNACGGTMDKLASREHARTAAQTHECPDPDWREVMGEAAAGCDDEAGLDASLTDRFYDKNLIR